MTEYSDSFVDAVKLLEETANIKTPKLTWGIPDPDIPNVWLLFTGGKKQSDWAAYIVYILDSDFEEVNVEEAIGKYGTPEIKESYKGTTFEIKPKNL